LTQSGHFGRAEPCDDGGEAGSKRKSLGRPRFDSEPQLPHGRPRGPPPVCRRRLPRSIVLCRPRRSIVVECSMTARRRFQLVLIKPSHYDDDGYVIRWWRAMIPSNSLAAVYAIAADCAERLVLGPDVAIDIEAIDETNTRIDVPALLARFRSHGNFGLVGLVGVQCYSCATSMKSRAQILLWADFCLIFGLLPPCSLAQSRAI
jgi:hypothetical protein